MIRPTMAPDDIDHKGWDHWRGKVSQQNEHTHEQLDEIKAMLHGHVDEDNQRFREVNRKLNRWGGGLLVAGAVLGMIVPAFVRDWFDSGKSQVEQEQSDRQSDDGTHDEGG